MPTIAENLANLLTGLPITAANVVILDKAFTQPLWLIGAITGSYLTFAASRLLGYQEWIVAKSTNSYMPKIADWRLRSAELYPLFLRAFVFTFLATIQNFRHGSLTDDDGLDMTFSLAGAYFLFLAYECVYRVAELTENNNLIAAKIDPNPVPTITFKLAMQVTTASILAGFCYTLHQIVNPTSKLRLIQTSNEDSENLINSARMALSAAYLLHFFTQATGFQNWFGKITTQGLFRTKTHDIPNTALKAVEIDSDSRAPGEGQEEADSLLHN